MYISAASTITLGIIVAAFATTPVLGSSGDENYYFQTCIKSCASTSCGTHHSLRSSNYADNSEEAPNTRAIALRRCTALCPLNNFTNALHVHLDSPSSFLKLMQWDCKSDCSYLCMWIIEREKSVDEPTEKYFGKWPFIRFLGAQEPASVIFSVLNLAANAWCLASLMIIRSSSSGVERSVDPRMPQALVVMLWAGHFLLSCNAWLWSSVFHCRDLGITERFDYFSAGALVAFDLFVTLTRTLEASSAPKLCMLGLPIAIAYFHHVRSMYFVFFDYGRHVALCVGAGVVQTIAWAAWATLSSSGRAHPGRRFLLSFMAAVNLAMLLEVLDFPPFWGVFDAHALWHAATTPLTFLWFNFVVADIGASGIESAVTSKLGMLNKAK